MMAVALEWKVHCIQDTPAMQGGWDCKLVTRDMSDNILKCVAGNVAVTKITWIVYDGSIAEVLVAELNPNPNSSSIPYSM